MVPWCWVLVLLLPWVVQGAKNMAVEKHCDWKHERELEECLPARRGTNCHCRFAGPNNETARCCHVDLRRIKDEISDCAGGGVPSELTALFLRNCTADKDELNLEALAAWMPKVRVLALTQGGYHAVREVRWEGGEFPALTCLNLSGNALVSTDPVMQLVNSTARRLHVLDLSNNNLTYAPDINQNPHENSHRSNRFWLGLQGNLQLKCDGLRELTLRNVSFLQSRETWCTATNNFTWFNSTDRINVLQIDATFKIQEDCPKQCKCTTDRLMYSEGETYYPAKVDCSGQRLTALPTHLPSKTFFLNVSNNNITNLDALINKKEHYKHLRVLIADNNQISSIQVLEGSEFLQRFEVFSLRYNELQSITMHFLSNSFEKNNWNSLALYLGYNFFHCDCSTYHTLKTWLIKYKKHIPDHEDIFCKETHQMIMHLQNTDVCVAQEEWTSYIYYLIAAEVALLLLLVGKVSYDYWVFKNVGYLPWPASKMPKLPCDCVLET